MITITTIDELREHVDRVRREGRTVGVVPTMGFLHEGHASLIDASAAANDLTVLTSFVNPTQFAPGEDLDRYPRDPDGDAALAESHGVDVVFAPPVEEMYPRPPVTTVTVSGIPEHLEGASRPDHFAGVATVVTKLFNIVQPDRAYFGEKDYQQVAMITRMVADLDLRVRIVPCPTVRHDDGLAMSSRNANLTPEERQAAPVLYRALRVGADAIFAGESDAATVRSMMATLIASEPTARLDYVEVAGALTCEPTRIAAPGVRLFGAVQFARARLIDNIGTADIGTEA